MGRWTQYDEDDHRLPEGMKRVGYDADTQQYTFQRGDQLWLGEPGAQYGGALTRAGTAPGKFTASSTVSQIQTGHLEDDDDVEGGYPPHARRDGYQPLNTGHGVQRPVYSNRAAYRSLFPFLLLLGIFLLFVWRFIVGYAPRVSGPHHCPTVNSTYRVEKGDSCWEIARTHGTTVEALQNQTLNPGLECDRLRPGDVLCIPLPTPTSA